MQTLSFTYGSLVNCKLLKGLHCSALVFDSLRTSGNTLDVFTNNATAKEEEGGGGVSGDTWMVVVRQPF